MKKYLFLMPLSLAVIMCFALIGLVVWDSKIQQQGAIVQSESVVSINSSNDTPTPVPTGTENTLPTQSPIANRETEPPSDSVSTGVQSSSETTHVPIAQPTSTPTPASTSTPTLASTSTPTPASTSTPAPASTSQQPTYEVELAALNAAHQDGRQQIIDLYEPEQTVLKQEISRNQQDANTFRSQMNAEIAPLSSSISSLQSQRDNEYGIACGNTGGYPNSYANTIVQRYNQQISSYNSQISSIRNTYAPLINACETNASIAQSAYDASINDMNADLAIVDQWYNDQLQALNEKYGL